jgi:hypothetical protein
MNTETVTKTAGELVVGDIIPGRNHYPARVTRVHRHVVNGRNCVDYDTEGLLHPGSPYVGFRGQASTLVEVIPASRNLDEALARLTRTIIRNMKVA